MNLINTACPPQNYDANLAIILDQDIDGRHKLVLHYDQLLIETSRDKIDIISPIYFQNLIKGEQNKLPQFINQERREAFEKTISEHTYQLGTELTDIILNGRINLFFLLNSPGGDNIIMSIYFAVIDEILSRQGNHSVYVTRRANSAAAMIFEKGKQRYALNDSELVWHLSDVASGDKNLTNYDEDLDFKVSTEEEALIQKELVNESKTVEMDRIRSFFNLALQNESLREQVLNIISEAEQDPNNQDNSVGFHGQTLRRLGIVNQSFGNKEMMRDHFFSAQPGLIPSKSIQKFFASKKRRVSRS